MAAITNASTGGTVVSVIAMRSATVFARGAGKLASGLLAIAISAFPVSAQPTAAQSGTAENRSQEETTFRFEDYEDAESPKEASANALAALTKRFPPGTLVDDLVKIISIRDGDRRGYCRDRPEPELKDWMYCQFNHPYSVNRVRTLSWSIGIRHDGGQP